MGVLPTCNTLVLDIQSPEEGVGFPGTGVTDGCELLCRCGESNVTPLKEQQVLLTTEPSLYSLWMTLKKVI